MDKNLFKARVDTLNTLKGVYEDLQKRVAYYKDLLAKCSAGVKAVSDGGTISYCGPKGNMESCPIPVDGGGGIHAFEFTENKDLGSRYVIRYGKEDQKLSTTITLKKGDAGADGEPGQPANTYYGKSFYDNNRVKTDIKPVSLASFSATGMSVGLTGVSVGVTGLTISATAVSFTFVGSSNVLAGMSTLFEGAAAQAAAQVAQVDGGGEENVAQHVAVAATEGVANGARMENNAVENNVQPVNLNVPGPPEVQNDGLRHEA